jgi:micrococcal nuclease
MPGTRCTIAVTYRTGVSSANGLEPKTADAAGAVAWSWTVGTNTTPGSWPVKVVCGAYEASTTLTVP